MDYKEEYERALGITKMWYRYSAMPDNVREILCKIFPELKESEEGKIRTWLEEHIEAMPDNSVEFKDVKRIDVLHWLEKQGDKCLVNFDEAEKEKYDFVSGQYIECIASFNEFKKDNSYWFEYIGNDTYIGRSDNILNQKHHITPRQLYSLFTQQHCSKEVNTNKVEPKFKVGQWIVWQDKCYKVNYNGCGYELVDQNGLSTSLEYDTIDENAHIWDIFKDAKNGDVLASKKTSCVLIFKDRDGTSFISYYNTSTDYNDDWNRVNFLPATKEQRKLLFAKMKKDGYKWDAENKQLKRI